MTIPANNPLAYLGEAAPNPPTVIKSTRAPTANDLGYPVGTLWVNLNTNESYQCVNNAAGVATWNVLSDQTGEVNTVPHGGTGRSTLTNHGVLVGAGTNPITQLSVGTSGQVLTGATGADPAFAALGTNSGLTAHGVLLGQGNGAITSLAPGSADTFLYSSGASADPVWSTFGNGIGTSVTLNSNAFSCNVVNDGFTVDVDTSTSVNVFGQECHIPNNGASLTTYTLPLSFVTAGETIKIVGSSSGGWKVAQQAGQKIYWNGSSSTTGATGSIASATAHDSVTLTCTAADGLNWVVVGYSGALVLT